MTEKKAEAKQKVLIVDGKMVQAYQFKNELPGLGEPENINITVDDWLNGKLDGILPQSNSGSLPVNPGQEPLSLYASGYLSKEEFEKISELQRQAFDMAVEFTVGSSIKWLKKQLNHITNQKRKQRFFERELNKVIKEWEKIDKYHKDRFDLGEKSEIGINSKKYQRICNFFGSYQKGGDTVMSEIYFKSVFDKKTGYNEDYKTYRIGLYLEELEKLQHEGFTNQKKIELNKSALKRIKAFSKPGKQIYKQARQNLAIGLEEEVAIVQPLKKAVHVLDYLKDEGYLKDVDSLPTDKVLEGYIDSYRTMYSKEYRKEEK